jgi:hypothetical protein
MSEPGTNRDPYRSSAGAKAAGAIDTGWPDRDILILLALVWPAFVAVVVRAIARGDTFGSGTTVCGGIAILVPALFVSSWRGCKRT